LTPRDIASRLASLVFALQGFVLPNCGWAEPPGEVNKSPVVGSSHLYNELIRLQEVISQKSISVSLDEAVVIGIKNNPKLREAFSVIQQFEWQLIAAQRKWLPELAMNNGTPFVGYEWSTLVQNQYGMKAFYKQVKKERSKKNDLFLGEESGISGANTNNNLESANQPSVGKEVSGNLANVNGQNNMLNSQPQSLILEPISQAFKSQQFFFSPGATVSWNFIDPRRQPDINASSESLKRQKYLFTASARGLILSIQEAYYGVQQSQQLIDSYKKIYAINKRQLSILEAQKNIGMATVLDVEQTRSQLFSQLNQLVESTQFYVEQTADLAALLALPPGTLAIPSDMAVIQGSWPNPLDETIQLALAQREEIMANLAAAESSQWRGISLIRSYLPVFQLVGTGSLNYQNGFRNVSVDNDPELDYASRSNWSASAGIGFSWSIFDGGINAANAQSSYAESREFKAAASRNKLNVTKQVKKSFGKMRTSQVAIESARAAYQSAELAQEAARARFSAGVGDITSVVQSIQLLSTAAQQVSSAIFNYNSAIAELYRYSSTWPGDFEMKVQRRVETMRNSSNIEPVVEDEL
jgi:outer membrane protein TolC